MISIDPHGQWPLTVRNFYVVLIMTKLVQLESEGLEYYLLGFDQGGKQSVNYSNNTSAGAEYRYKLPISYKSKCIAAIGSTETNLDNGWTYININYAPNKSNNSELTFHCWTDWDWSYKGFRLSIISIGF